MRKILKKVNLIHLNIFPANYLALLSIIFCNSKIVITEHAIESKRKKYKFFKVIDKYFLYRKAKKVVAVSQICKKKLDDWLEGVKDIEVIYNGVNIEYFRNGISLRENFIPKITKKDKIICMVSRLHKDKDHITVIKALKKLPENIKCIFVGEGPEREKIENLIKEMELKNRVFLVGDQKNVRDYLKTSDLGILSSKAEGFGLTLIETLASGRLIIGSNVSGISEILDEKELLFEYKNVNDLVQKIENILIKNKNVEYLEEKMKKKLELYTLERMLKKYEKIYEDVLCKI